MTRKSLLCLILLNMIPAALSFLYPLGGWVEILAAAAMIAMIIVNLLISDRFWISLLAMAVSAALCVCGCRFSLMMYYTHINAHSATPLLSIWFAKLFVIIGIASVALYGILGFIKLMVRKHRKKKDRIG